MSKVNQIPLETALELCQEIQSENKNKLFSFAKLQCWGCCRYAKGNAEKMCLSGKEGCNLINQRYQKQKGGLS